MDLDLKNVGSSLVGNIIYKKEKSPRQQLHYITSTLNMSKKIFPLNPTKEAPDTYRKESSDSTTSNAKRLRIIPPFNSPDLYRNHNSYESVIGSIKVNEHSKLGKNSYTVSEFNEFKNKLLRNNPKMGISNKSNEKTIIYDFNTYKKLQSEIVVTSESRFTTTTKKTPFLKSHQIKSIYDSINFRSNRKNDELANHLVTNFGQLRQVSLTELKRFNLMNKKTPHENVILESLMIKKLK